MRNLVYPVNYFYNTLPELDLINIEINVIAVADNGAHAFVFARKNNV